MTKYREIIRLAGLNLSQTNIALSCNASKTTVNKVLKAAKEQNLVWPLDPKLSDSVLGKLLFPKVKAKPATSKRMPDFEQVRKELLRKGVNKKLLWTEYLEECRLSKEEPLMYSQFCYYIQQDEQKRRATMHINRKPAEQVEVDWAGDPAHIIDPDTGEILDAQIFVGVMTYRQYPYVEVFMDQKQALWIAAHIHMYKYFGGVAKILVPDNCRTVVDHNNKSWNDPRINAVYQEMAEHYSTAIIPARVRSPKDKPNVEGSVGNISTWITAALRNEQFFSLGELNQAIRQKLEDFSHRLFQKKEGSRYEIFRDEELPLLASLPVTPYELAEWRQATVQFNYHIAFAGMLYSVPHELKPFLVYSLIEPLICAWKVGLTLIKMLSKTIGFTIHLSMLFSRAYYFNYGHSVEDVDNFYYYLRCKTKAAGLNKMYQELAGKRFWAELIWNEDFYIMIIEYIGIMPKKYVADYNERYNKLVREFANSFCLEDGSIDWEKLL